MGFSAYKDIIESRRAGEETYSSWRKTPTQTTTAGIWFDLAMSPGNPPPIYYASAPLIGVPLRKSTDGGLNHGQNVSPRDKFMSRFLIMSSSGTGLPMMQIVCDYLFYYPFIDQSTNDVQFLDNTLSLTRNVTGRSNQILAVSTNANSGLLPFFSLTYTNQDGVGGRVTPTCRLLSATATGQILTSNTGAAVSAMPFVPLQEGDYGVRSIESFTITSGADVGLLCLVIVNPLGTNLLLEQTAPSEYVLLSDASPMKIEDDACINLLCLPLGSLSGVQLNGEIETIFN